MPISPPSAEKRRYSFDAVYRDMDGKSNDISGATALTGNKQNGGTEMFGVEPGKSSILGG